jgi:hypothetical protein
VVRRPRGSGAVVDNPRGAVSMSRHWEYAYEEGNVPSFTADADGDYELQLQARLALPDRAYPEHATSTSSLTLAVAPAGGMSCASVPAASGGALGVGLLWMLARRRRR